MYGSMPITRSTVPAEPPTSKHGGMSSIGMWLAADTQIPDDSARCLLANRLVIGGNDDHEAWLQLPRRW